MHFPGSSDGKESTCNAGETLVWFPGWEDLWRRDRLPTPIFLGFPGASAGKKSACNVKDLGLIPGLGKFPWRRPWLPTPVFLPGKSPWTEKPGGLQPMGSQRFGHDWVTKHSMNRSQETGKDFEPGKYQSLTCDSYHDHHHHGILFGPGNDVFILWFLTASSGVAPGSPPDESMAIFVSRRRMSKT